MHISWRMSRIKRVHSPGVPCHVTARLQNGEPLFAGLEADVARRISTVAALYRTPLLAHCVMSNHVHLVIVQTDQPLGTMMHALLRRLALLVHRVHGRNGHVFCGPHFVRPCTDASYLREVLAYVHLNPVRANICADAIDYRWSTHREYLTMPETSLTTSGDRAHMDGLRMFAPNEACSIGECVIAYNTFLTYRRRCDALINPEYPLMERSLLPAPPAFPGGDRHFAALYSSNVDASGACMLPVRRRLTDISTLVRWAMDEMGAELTIDDLRAGGRAAPMVELRTAAITRCLLAGHPPKAIARYLQISGSAVSRVAVNLRRARQIINS